MSEKKQPEAELHSVRYPHYDFQDMMMHAPIGIFSSTPGGRFVYVNMAMARMLGYDSPRETMESVVNIGEQIYADPEERGKIHRRLEGHDERLNNECRLVRKDGSRFWASYDVRAVRNEKGDIVYYEGFLTDITEQKNEREALRKTQFAMDRAPDSILWIDDEGKIVYANDSACASMGYEREELHGMKVFDIDPDFQPDQWERHKETVRKLGSMTFESRHRTKNGHTFPVEVSTNHFKFDDHYLACAFDRDITGRKRAEKELRDREGVLRSMLEATPVGVALLKDRIFKKVNKSLCRITGYTEEEMTGMMTRILYPDDAEFSRIGAELYKQMEREGLGVRDAVLKGKDGSLIDVVLSLSPFDTDDSSAGVCATIQDITERKRTEEALRASEMKFRMLHQSMRDAFVVVDMEGRIQEFNDSFLNMLGYAPEEIVRLTYRDITPERWHEMERAIIEKQVLTDGFSDVYEKEYRRKDGTVLPVELRTTLLKDAKGVPVHLWAMVRDITDRKQAVEALQKSEKQYRLIVELMTDIVWMADMNLRTVYITSSVLKVTGFSAEEVMVKTIDELMTPDSVSLALDTMATELALEQEGHANPERTVNLLLEYYHKDGSTRWLETVIRGLRNDQGVLTGLHGVSRDVTERRRIEEKLRFSEEWHRSLMEDAPAGFCIVDKKARIQYVNKIIEEATGYSRQELVGRNVFETGLFSEDYERIMADRLKMRIAGTAPHPDTIEMPVICKDGKITWIEMYTRIHIEDGVPAGAQVVMVNITDRKRAEEEKEKLKEQLDRAQRLESIGTLAGGVAHDFNNVLMGIQGNAALMMLDIDPADPHYQQLMYIEEHVKSGADLTRKLLGFARGGRYAMKPADMNVIVEKNAAMFGRTKKEITIHKKYGNDLWNVKVDETQMGQVFMNLFVNAWQAMPGGGEIFLETENLVLDDEKARALSVSEGKYVRIAITDTGTGMDAKTSERIFDPFFTTKEMGRGTGLGLSTVYGIIKGHGGAICATSQLGQGTTFIIYLPTTEKSVIAERSHERGILRGTETILLVDDEATVQDVTSRMLQSLGYRVHCAGSGREAVAVFHEKKDVIDLVILDMIMPGMSGGETFHRLREINPKQKILFSSGYSADDRAKELREKGCSDFIQKPFTLGDLAREVRSALDRKERSL
ncbi:MAG TPA: PAS domain S-box protein [Syntrophales bacterium]|nr:PAS domain S-box protein [Syntrophales bacterium]